MLAMTNAFEQQPAPGYLLVQLGDYYEGIKMPESKYDSKTEGTVIKVSEHARTPDHKYLAVWAIENLKPGIKVFWREYAEGKRQTFEGQQTAFIRIEDIEGYEQGK